MQDGRAPRAADNIITGALNALGDERKRVIEPLLKSLTGQESVLGVFVEGSVALGTVDAFTDIDIIVVAKDNCVAEAEAAIQAYVASSEDVMFTGHTNKYPWFGRLNAIYWRTPFLFAADIGCINAHELTTFFVEPTAMILKDVGNRIQERLLRQATIAREGQEEELSSYELFNSLVKLRKSLHRRHLWNAFECISIMRRAYIRGMRQTGAAAQRTYYGRPERNIEDVLPPELLAQLVTTIPAYSTTSLAGVGVSLGESILALPLAADWRGRESVIELLRTIRVEFSSY